MIVALLALLATCVPLLGPEHSAARASGDEAFFAIRYPDAVTAYETALRLDPDDVETLWRLARVLVCMGEVADAAGRDSLLRAAERHARRAISLQPDRTEGHTWLAGALGFLALDAGGREQVELATELLAEADRALACDPANDVALGIKGSCYRALGNVSWLRRRLAGIFFGEVPDGGFAEAEVALRKAIVLAPTVMRHHYELAALYLDWHRERDALTALEEAVRLPVRIASDRPRRAKIQELLLRLGGEEPARRNSAGEAGVSKIHTPASAP